MSKLQIALVVVGFGALAVHNVMIILQIHRQRHGLKLLAGAVHREMGVFRIDHQRQGAVLRNHLTDANDIGRRVETLERLIEPAIRQRGDSRPDGVA